MPKAKRPRRRIERDGHVTRHRRDRLLELDLIADAVAHLRASGHAAPDALLAHTSPVGWGHIGFSGDFLWDRAAAMAVGRRALNLVGTRLAA